MHEMQNKTWKREGTGKKGTLMCISLEERMEEIYRKKKQSVKKQLRR